MRRSLLFIPVVAGVLLTGAACANQEPTRVVTVGNGETQTTTPAAADQDTYGSGEVSVSPAPTKAATGTGTEADDPDALTPFSPGSYSVLIRGFDSAKHTVLVERVKLSTGDVSGMKVTGLKDTYTLPVKSAVKVHTVSGGNPDCMGKSNDEYAIPGTCSASVSLITKNLNPDGFLAQIKVNTTNVYEINELYTS